MTTTTIPPDATAFPTRLPGAVADTLMWADPADVEDAALAQLRTISRLPWVHGLRVMPDVHLGKGATVGSVVAMRDAVSPAAVGDRPDHRGPPGGPAGPAPRDRARRPGGLPRARRRPRRRPARSRRGRGRLGHVLGRVRRPARDGPRPRVEGHEADGLPRRRQPLHRGDVGRRRTGVAHAALRVAQHRQGAGGAAHRGREGPGPQPGPARPRPRRLPRRHRTDAGVPARPVLGAGLRRAQPCGHDGARPRGRHDVLRGPRSRRGVRPRDLLPPQLRGAGAVRRRRPGGHPARAPSARVRATTA